MLQCSSPGAFSDEEETDVEEGRQDECKRVRTEGEAGTGSGDEQPAAQQQQQQQRLQHPKSVHASLSERILASRCQAAGSSTGTRVAPAADVLRNGTISVSVVSETRYATRCLFCEAFTNRELSLRFPALNAEYRNGEDDPMVGTLVWGTRMMFGLALDLSAMGEKYTSCVEDGYVTDIYYPVNSDEPSKNSIWKLMHRHFAECGDYNEFAVRRERERVRSQLEKQSLCTAEPKDLIRYGEYLSQQKQAGGRVPLVKKPGRRPRGGT